MYPVSTLLLYLVSLSRRRHRLAEAHNARAQALRQQGQLQEAVREYGRALEAEPGNFKALFNRGFTHDRVGGQGGANCFLHGRIRNPACKDPYTSQGLQGQRQDPRPKGPRRPRAAAPGCPRSGQNPRC